MAKNTNDLLDQLADNNCSIDDYLEEKPGGYDRFGSQGFLGGSH